MTWRDDARCAGYKTEMFFSAAPSMQRMAKLVCAACPVRGECLSDAMAWERALTGEGEAISLDLRAGIFGGLTHTERWAREFPAAARKHFADEQTRSERRKAARRAA